MKTKQIGTYFIYTGLLLLAAALCLFVYNMLEEKKASESVSDVLREILPETEKTTEAYETYETLAPQKTDAVTENEKNDAPETEPTEIETEMQLPDYILDPNMAMPTSLIDGQKYIGVVEIPVLDLRLPIISEWSYPRLKIAPCRYQGSVYLDNLIIAGHNYKSHFGSLLNLNIGDKVYFTDMNGNVFSYDVVELETVKGTDIDGMVSGDWDLTLFTCTLVRKTRVTVRCERSAE